MSTENLIGLSAAYSRGTRSADVVMSVEQVSGGDLLLTVGTVYLCNDAPGRANEQAAVRLNADDRDRLIEQLTFARTADLETQR